MARKFLGKIFCSNTSIIFVTFVTLFLMSKKYDVHLTKKQENIETAPVIIKHRSDNDIKYILQWTSPKHEPFVFMGIGNSTFITNNCEYKNCFVTSDRDYLGDYTKFDVIVFSAPDLVDIDKKSALLLQEMLPQKRSPFQKYVFACIESSHYYPICSDKYDGYFNWTWTFKLDSDARWEYFIVRDSNGTIIGPNKEMHWLKTENMDPVPDDLREKLKTKSKLAAWFASNCHSINRREILVKNLNRILKKSGYELDIYGKCGSHRCSRNNETKCNKMIERDYYFYLAFENSLSEDYVTEKLLRALEFNAVPIVYGGANYTRFMPDGIYLDAGKTRLKDLAKKMLHLMKNFEEYVEYFKWKNHYTYHRRNIMPETNDYCGHCAILNNEGKVKEISVYEDFRTWWNPPTSC